MYVWTMYVRIRNETGSVLIAKWWHTAAETWRNELRTECSIWSNESATAHMLKRTHSSTFNQFICSMPMSRPHRCTCKAQSPSYSLIGWDCRVISTTFNRCTGATKRNANGTTAKRRRRRKRENYASCDDIKIATKNQVNKLRWDENVCALRAFANIIFMH